MAISRNGEIVFYPVEINYDFNRKYGAKIGYSKDTMKKHKNTRFSFRPGKLAVIVSLSGTLLGYSALQFAKNHELPFKNIETKIEQLFEKPSIVAYTNVTDNEFSKLSFEDKVGLYENYFKFINESEPYIQNDKSYNIDVNKIKIQEALNEYYMFKNAWHENNQDYLIKETENKIFLVVTKTT